MTILRVHENINIKGGSEVYIRDVSIELERLGYRNIFLVIEKTSFGYTLYIDRKLTRKISAGQLSATLDEILSQYTIDLVHIHGLSDRVGVGYFIRNYKVVRTMHEPRLVCPGYSKFWVNDNKPCEVKFGAHCFLHAYTQQCFRSRNPWKVLEAYQNTVFEVKEAALQYKFVLTMSEYIREEAIIGGIGSEKILCIPHFTKFRLPFMPLPGILKFLFVGRLIKHKGINELKEAILPVVSKFNNVRFDIIGDGPMYNEVIDFISRNNLEQNVFVSKWKSSEEISSMMHGASAVLFPSVYPEAFGLVGIEAAMHSRPVIAFNRGGVGTWLRNNYNGLLLDDATSASLSESIIYFIEHPEVAAEMGFNAWERANREFTADRHVASLVEVYKKVVIS